MNSDSAYAPNGIVVVQTDLHMITSPNVRLILAFIVVLCQMPKRFKVHYHESVQNISSAHLKVIVYKTLYFSKMALGTLLCRAYSPMYFTSLRKQIKNHVATLLV